MTLWAISSPSDTSSWVRPHSSRPIILPQCGLPAYRYMKTGIPVKILELPWLVDIYHGASFLGTGVLVNDTMILTTTSVVEPWGISMKFLQLKVHFGFAPANRNASDYLFERATVKQIIFHAFADHRFDLCLLQLGLAMTDSLIKFHPICFSHFKLFNEVGDEIAIAAYISKFYC
ncbi:uncharacterized protein TNCV_4539481 [Trichonephila clavipes]|nr:uncharacterized protein TNCV_4539481 [Trichonephila clavipes]